MNTLLQLAPLWHVDVPQGKELALSHQRFTQTYLRTQVYGPVRFKRLRYQTGHQHVRVLPCVRPNPLYPLQLRPLYISAIAQEEGEAEGLNLIPILLGAQRSRSEAGRKIRSDTTLTSRLLNLDVRQV